MKKNIFKMAALIVPFLILASCTDLDLKPENTSVAEEVFSTFEGTKGALAKIYAAYTLTGNQGPSGMTDLDVPGFDEGQNADFLRGWFNHQTLPTEEAHCLWNDAGIPDLNFISFTADNFFSVGLYYRMIIQTMYVNEFLRNADESLGAEVATFKAEARFIRAFDYWVLMDLFGNPPFITEDSELNVLPEQINRTDLFEFIESELLDIANNNLLKAPKANEYGRADQAAAWALLARLYLNAEVYTGTPRWADAITYSKKVIGAGYSILPNNYEYLFFADNNLNNPEIILPITFDGINTRTNGGTAFLSKCPALEQYSKSHADVFIGLGYSVNIYWNGYRVRKEFLDKFDSNDKRRLFIGNNPALGSDPSKAENGFAPYKYRNIKPGSTLGNVISSNGEFSDIDFPLFRLAEQYLIYAEAVARGGGGSRAEAVGYINELRDRAGVWRIGDADLTTDFILDERARELYWECFRRTDLIRYNRFTSSNYVWEWKGGVQNGRGVDARFNLYPIPASDINANTNLDQNDGY